MSYSVWIARKIEEPPVYGPFIEAWRLKIEFNEQWGDSLYCKKIAHEYGKRLRKTLKGSLVAVRATEKGEPLWAEGMPDHYELPPYCDDHEQI